jgi:hypothetical protein
VNLTASIRLPGEPRVPPARFRIWRAGSNPGDYGDLFFTPAAAARVMAGQALRGVSMIIDIEHNRNARVNPNPDPNKPPVTGGYIDIELVGPSNAPELWGVPRWSDCGAPFAQPGIVCCGTHQITSGQREYVSPDWDLDPETREPIRLNRVSLVGEPGTYGISMLASAGANRGTTMDEIAKLRAAYAAMMGMSNSTDPEIKAAAVALSDKLKTQAATLGIDLEAAGDAPAGDAPAIADAGALAPPPVDPAKPATAAATMPAIAALASRAAVRVDAERPATMAEIRRMLAEDAERKAMAADPRLSSAMRNVVASADLATARSIVKALPAAPIPEGTNGDDGGPVNHVASAHPAATVSMNAADRFAADRIADQLGVTPENVTAARKIMETDPEGAVAVSLKTLMEKHRARRNPGAAAMRFGG